MRSGGGRSSGGNSAEGGSGKSKPTTTTTTITTTPNPEEVGPEHQHNQKWSVEARISVPEGRGVKGP